VGGIGRLRPMLQVTVGRMRLLKEDERQDVEALQTAGLRLRLPCPGGPRVTRNGEGIGPPFARCYR
jgi:hypothetical protein